MPALRPWVAALAAVTLFGLTAESKTAHAQWKAPKWKAPKWKAPKVNVRPPRLPDVKPPRLDVNPKKELLRARERALGNLRKLDPDDILRNTQRAIQNNISRAQAQTGVRFNKQTGVADLRESPMGRTLARWLRNFTQGNARESRVEEMSYNVRTRDFRLRLYARHWQRQNWGALGKVDLYSVTQRAVFTYNFRTGAGDFDIDLGQLAPRISKKTWRSLQEGDLAAVAESLGPRAIGKIVKFERKNEYDAKLREYQRRYGADHVYMASRRFVEWAGSKSIGKYAATGVLSGGSAVYPQIMRDAKVMARKELADITRWLQRLGQKEARRMAEYLITGKRPKWPHVRFEMIVVKHSAREVLATGQKTPWRHFNNLAFVIVCQPKGKG